MTHLLTLYGAVRVVFSSHAASIRIVLFCCTVAAASLFLTGAAERGDGVVDVGLTTVQRSAFFDSVERRGVVEPMSSTPVHSECYWTTNIISIVPEGTFVREGDVVCVLDASEVEEYKQKRELTLLTYRNRLQNARHAQAMLESDNERRLSAAQHQFQTANYEEGEYLGGKFPQMVQEMEQKLQLLTESAESIADETRHVEKLWAMGMVGTQEMEQQSLELMNSRENIRQQQSRLNLLTKFTHPRSELKLGNTRTQALRNVNRVQLTNSMAETRSRITILSYEKTLRVYERYHKRAVDSIAACTITAPRDGQVMYGNSWYLMSRGITQINEGAQVRRQQKIFEIPDPRRLKVSVPLDESLVYRVHRGMPVSVSLVGYEDSIIAGEITKIPRYPKSRGKYSPGIKDYWLEVELLPTEEQRDFIKFKSDVAVEIVINNIPDALQIPRNAVTGVAGDNFVYVFDGKELVPRKVILGVANEEFACVEDGLLEGDQLVTEMTPQHQESLRAVLAAAVQK